MFLLPIFLTMNIELLTINYGFLAYAHARENFDFLPSLYH